MTDIPISLTRYNRWRHKCLGIDVTDDPSLQDSTKILVRAIPGALTATLCRQDVGVEVGKRYCPFEEDANSPSQVVSIRSSAGG